MPIITEQYATADDGTPLFWVKTLAHGTAPNPKVLLIHGGGFVSGDARQVSGICAPALSAAGYDCYALEYRLAPPNKIAGQTSNGRFPDQTNDIDLAVAAAKALNQEKVFALGGSAGGADTLWLAGCSDSVSAVVAISPASQFDDPESLQGHQFNKVVNHYAPGHLDIASPNNHLTANSKPVMLVAFERDHMPAPQYQLALGKLIDLGIPHQALLLPGSGHSYPSAWPLMKDQAIAFFNANRASDVRGS